MYSKPVKDIRWETKECLKPCTILFLKALNHTHTPILPISMKTPFFGCDTPEYVNRSIVTDLLFVCVGIFGDDFNILTMISSENILCCKVW